jgi:hypothetical protein
MRLKSYKEFLKMTFTGIFKNGRNVGEHVWTQKEHTLKEIEFK